MSDLDPVKAPYGAFALSPFQEWLRRSAMQLPSDRLRRAAESVVRRVLMSDGREIADVEVFPGQHARVHMRDNRCEKRAFVGSRTWDSGEREAIRDVIRKAPADREIVFVDAGANAGLYTLSVLADAERFGKRVRVVAVEPDVENRRRLEFNLEASGADQVHIAPVALGAEEKFVNLVQDDRNRGEVRIGENDAGGAIPMKPLSQVLDEAGIQSVDVMKMDIEGFEEPVLSAFFKMWPRSRWPRTVLLETLHAGAQITDGAPGICLEHGYQVAQLMRQNAVLVLPEGEVG
ncbi:MAG: FkbM family methyltransferase [Alphaproteobacteria bacterium]|nr:FkbM family methyltransferase [Alphaproteobacteria bacterium]